MGKNSGVEWTHHTFNGWWGCRRVLVDESDLSPYAEVALGVDPACLDCYADRDATRYGFPKLWSGAHRFFGDRHWREPEKWDRSCAERGVRERVFAFSFGDVFEDHPDLVGPRLRFLRLVDETPNLDWLVLSKRIEKIDPILRGTEFESWPGHRENVWLGTSFSDQRTAELRVPLLLRQPARLRFVSFEPAVEPVDLQSIEVGDRLGSILYSIDAGAGIDWLVAGGKSGPRAKPHHPEIFRTAREQATAARIPFFFKQWGEWLPLSRDYPGIVWRSGKDETPRSIEAVRVDGKTYRKIEIDPDDSIVYVRVGKKVAGAMLDGREWREIPRAA